MSEQPTSREQSRTSEQVERLRTFVKDAIGKQAFDDRVDTRTDITTREALTVLSRSLSFIPKVKWLFSAKLLLQLGTVLPLLILPWIGRIIIDSVVQQKPLHSTDVRFPPFMNPIVDLLEGRDPVGIMSAIVVLYLCWLVIMGGRFGNGTGASLLQGQDAATQGENRLSAGGSRVRGVYGIVEYLVHVRLTQRLANLIRVRLFQRLTRLPMEVMDDQRIGDSLYRVLYDAPMGPGLIYELTLTPILMVILAITNIYMLEYSFGHVAPELIWIAWLTIPVAFAITYPFSGPLRRTSQNKRSAGSATTNSMEESLSNVATVQSLGAEEEEKERFAAKSKESFRRERLSIAVVYVAVLVFGGVTGLAALYVTILVSDQIIDGLMTVGDFAVLTGAYFTIAGAAGYFGAYWIKLQDVIAAMRRVYFFMGFESEEDQQGTTRLGSIESGIELRDVSFHYGDGGEVLKSISAQFNMGEMVAIVGPTGSGKTTLAYLIPRFLMPTQGQVLLDSKPLEDMEITSLRDQITYVFQEHLLLSESIRANLLFANPSATEDQMQAALEQASIWDYIETLPEGLDTRIGRSGDTLSVGQQQRISIARGLIRNTPILILDEPTAALDPQTEAAMMKALRDESQNRIVIVIAHRLSTIRQADKILFLDDGMIRGVGDHETLMSNPDSPYRDYVELQTA